MLRQEENFAPRRGSPRLVVANLFLDLGVTGDDMVMAKQAFFHRRQSRVQRARYIRVTERTVDGFVPRVQTMTERDRLLRTQPRLGVYIKEVDKPQHQHNRQSGQGQGQPVGDERLQSFPEAGNQPHRLAAGADQNNQGCESQDPESGKQYFHYLLPPALFSSSSGNCRR